MVELGQVRGIVHRLSHFLINKLQMTKKRIEKNFDIYTQRKNRDAIKINGNLYILYIEFCIIWYIGSYIWFRENTIYSLIESYIYFYIIVYIVYI